MATVCKTALNFDYDRPEIKLVSPEAARKLLSTSNDHSGGSTKDVMKYANEIRMGLWKSPKHKVFVYPNGKLASGHAFLYGILEAGEQAKLFFERSPYKQSPARFDFDGPEVRIVTPDVARMLLATSEVKQPVPKGLVSGYVTEIMAGEWRRTTKAIKMSANGELVGGHEYLHAIIRAGLPVKLLYELSETVQQDPQRESPKVIEMPSPAVGKSSGRTFTLEMITPELAKIYLGENKGNRNIRKSSVAQYVKDMLDGNWRSTHQGIAFNSDGVLIDGQHRLHAIIESNVSVEMVVARGLEMEDGAAIDIGAIRSEANIAHYLNIELTCEHTACARAMKMFQFDRSTSRRQVVDVVREHIGAIEFAIASAKGPKTQNAVFRGVVARALSSRPSDKERIERFVEIASGDGGALPGEEGAHVLRKWLANEDVSKLLHSASNRKALYHKIENALKAFLDRRAIVRCDKAVREMFPIPGEVD